MDIGSNPQEATQGLYSEFKNVVPGSRLTLRLFFRMMKGFTLEGKFLSPYHI